MTPLHTHHTHTGHSVSNSHVSRILQGAVDTLYVWHARAQHRHELRGLLTRDDRIFRDIGRDREDIAWEAIKPFWQA